MKASAEQFFVFNSNQPDYRLKDTAAQFKDFLTQYSLIPNINETLRTLPKETPQ
ncbi:unnamed protein product [marine sediment metagenome]|uniref:Uncharacterized protein n=1 Tax=marine sediment metagenome TaxID=412755 RepID=X0YF71_9ZZZZ